MKNYGFKLNFGKYEGKTIEQLHFIDYGYLAWLFKETNRTEIKEYLSNLPQIYPQKIKQQCYGYQTGQCTNQFATRISALYDYKGNPLILPGVHYWCNECNIELLTGYRKKLIEIPLDFGSVFNLRRKADKKGFHQIMRIAYGIERLTAKNAYELFWR